jgi:hypothetical protein
VRRRLKLKKTIGLNNMKVVGGLLWLRQHFREADADRGIALN